MWKKITVKPLKSSGDLLTKSNSKREFFENLNMNFSEQSVANIEEVTLLEKIKIHHGLVIKVNKVKTKMLENKKGTC